MQLHHDDERSFNCTLTQITFNTKIVGIQEIINIKNFRSIFQYIRLYFFTEFDFKLLIFILHITPNRTDNFVAKSAHNLFDAIAAYH